MKRPLAFGIALSLLWLAPARAQSAPAQSGLLDRIVVVGASVSAGFGLDRELLASADLGTFFEAALCVPPGSITNLGDGMFFGDPLAVGAEQIDAARKLEPTLLLGLDFLFWYGYGSQAEQARLARFEKGLAELASLDCAMVISDLPDMTAALHGSSPLAGGGPLLGADQIPAPESLVKMNARLHEWAAERPKVIVLALSDFVATVVENKELTVLKQHYAEGSSTKLLQSDLLHPTVEGTAIFVLMTLAELLQVHDGLDSASFASTTEPILKRVMELTEAERAKRQERERKRAERRRLRDEKREKESAGGGLTPLIAR